MNSHRSPRTIKTIKRFWKPILDKETPQGVYEDLASLLDHLQQLEQACEVLRDELHQVPMEPNYKLDQALSDVEGLLPDETRK